MKEENNQAQCTLTWSPLRRFSEFPELCPPSTRSRVGLRDPAGYKLTSHWSVYIWGFVHHGVFLPYCVGKTGRPFERVMQHYSNLRGGLYPIYHRDSLCEFYQYKDAHTENGDVRSVKPESASGMLYTPCSPYAQWWTFMHPNVQREVAYLLDAFRFAHAETPEPPRGSNGKYVVSKSEFAGMFESGLADALGRGYLQSFVCASPAAAESLAPRPWLHLTTEERPHPLVDMLNVLEPSRGTADPYAGRGPVTVVLC